MKPQAAMILAAGLGTRMRPLTDHCPKPLLKAGGRTLLDRALDCVSEAGIGRAVVNMHYLGHLIRAHLANRSTEPALPEIRISDETGELLDTGGGVARALPMLGPSFAVLNSDAVWPGCAPLAPLLAAWAETDADALMLLVPRERAGGATRPGDFFLDGSCPVRRGEATTAPYVFTGAQILRANAFEDAPDGAFSLNLIWDRLIATGRLRAIVHEGGWIDAGTPEGLALAESALAEEGD